MYSIGQHVETKFNTKKYKGTIAHLEDGEYIIYYHLDHSTMKTKLPMKHTKLLKMSRSHLVGEIIYIDKDKKYGNVFDKKKNLYLVFFPTSNTVLKMSEDKIEHYKLIDQTLIKNIKFVEQK
jgi:hypothetical protein